jgi:hypothetical protein
MARDVEYDVVARDKSGPGLDSAVRRAQRASKQIQAESDKIDSKFGKGLVSAVESVSPKLASSLVRAMKGASSAAAPALGGVAIAAAPLIAATMSAAVIGGISLGVAGIGVALVSQDARVKSAGTQLGQTLMASLKQDAAPFIEPVLRGIATIGDRFETMRGRIQNIFRNASKFVEPLINGATKGFAGILRGVDILVSRAQPVVDAIGDGLADLGSDFGDFLVTISGNSDDAATALRSVFDQMGAILKVSGPVINALTKIYGFFDKFAPGGLTVIGKLFDGAEKAQSVGKWMDPAITAFQEADTAAQGYADAVARASAAVADMAGQQRSLYASTTAARQAIADAKKGLEEHGRGLDINTQKGRDNREALARVANALVANYEGYVKVNGAGSGAAKIANNNRDSFVRLAMKLGSSASAAQTLANKLLGIPSRRETKITANTAAAMARARELQAKLNSIRDRTVRVNIAFNEGRLNNVERRLDRIGANSFSASAYWSAVNGGSGARTGGPAEVAVANTVNVALDGSPFRTLVTTSVAGSERRTALRAKVGPR